MRMACFCYLSGNWYSYISHIDPDRSLEQDQNYRADGNCVESCYCIVCHYRKLRSIVYGKDPDRIWRSRLCSRRKRSDLRNVPGGKEIENDGTVECFYSTGICNRCRHGRHYCTISGMEACFWYCCRSGPDNSN